MSTAAVAAVNTDVAVATAGKLMPWACRWGFHRWTCWIFMERGRTGFKLGPTNAGFYTETYKRVCVQCHQPEIRDFK